LWLFLSVGGWIVSGQHYPSALSEIDVRSSKFYDGKVLEVPIGPDAGIEIFQKWMEQAYSGLFAAIANKRWEALSALL